MKNISIAIASASALLLGTQAHGAPMNTEVDASTQVTDSVTPINKNAGTTSPYRTAPAPWKFDTAILGYHEKDRVTAGEPVISASKDFGGERVLNAKLVLDGLTGASPNGAAPASVAQTFTSPSGTSKHREHEDGDGMQHIKAGQLPLDDSFQDVRAAVNVGWSQPLNATMKGSIGGNFSKEYDYTSMGVNAALSKDFNEKNTTISGGLSFEHDWINPVAGAPIGLTDTADVQKQGDKTKSVIEAMIGVTQLLSPKAYYQLNYSYSNSHGYMTDPYKMLTLVDDNDRLIPKTTADTYTYLYEKRPETRVRHALFNRVKYRIGDNTTLDTSYRYTSDDWGVKTHTVDTKVRFDVADKKYYVEPHVRWYHQSAADFYAPYLQQGSVGQYASADSRLGAFNAMTLGGKIGWHLNRDQEISLRLESYQQRAKKVAAPSTGELAGQKMQPNLNAFMAQIGWRFKW